MRDLVHAFLGGLTMAERLSNLFAFHDVSDAEGQAGPSGSELVTHVPAEDDAEMENEDYEEEGTRTRKSKGKGKGIKGKSIKGSRSGQRATRPKAMGVKCGASADSSFEAAGPHGFFNKHWEECVV